MLLVAALAVSSSVFAQSYEVPASASASHSKNSEVPARAAVVSVKDTVKKAEPKEVVVVITLDTTSFKQLLFTIDQSIDSKQVTKALIELLQKNARLVDMDKPKKIK